MSFEYEHDPESKLRPRITFFPARSGVIRIPFRSLLEARWALTFEMLGFDVLCPPNRRDFQEAYPPLYTDHVDKIFSFTKGAYFDGPYSLAEMLFLEITEMEARYMKLVAKSQRRIDAPVTET